MVDPGTDNDGLREGLYDSLSTRRLLRAIDRTDFVVDKRPVTDADSPDVLARHLMEVAGRRLAEISHPERRIEVLNELVVSLGSPEEQVERADRVVALRQPETIGRESAYLHAPLTPLGQPALLTNSRGEPSLGAEIRSELGSADGVDLLCAFIKWHGVRTLEKQLAALGRRGVPLRVITTTYLGATERRALDRLVRDFGADVKVNFEVTRTRLHAKAWMFHRNTRFDTAYVGSSNLSTAALLDGVEWNVRLTSVATPSLVRKFNATFDTYWADPSFRSYDPDRDAELLDRALHQAGGAFSGRASITLSGIEVRPYPHQQQMLEQLDVEREVHGHHRNLVVAATGTGKTVVAALDYRSLCQRAGRRPSLLFIAHRREILDQALRTYQDVLADASFGELFVGGDRPSAWQHVFASVQSLHGDRLATFRPDQFEVVVIDEFHHAEASSYRRIMGHFTPRELLGLTATPERADGVDVREFFGYRTAAELRLWDALSAELLSPFHYFGIADGTDLSRVAWRRGTYDADQLTTLFTGNDARARIVLREVNDKVSDPRGMRALGFCVGVSHAHYMARVFTDAGIPSRALSGNSSARERADALRALREREVNCLFTADLYNEGVDLPDVDTVLFLRPTDSPTIFLQQLGRGLRRAPDKAVLTALDFVGNQHVEFRYDRKFSAMTGIGRRELRPHVDDGFPLLPSGCQILLDRQSERLLLESVRRQVTSHWRTLVDQLRDLGDVSLPRFLDSTDTALPDLLKGERSWTRARREAGLPTRAGHPGEEALLRRGKAFAHVDDADRRDAYLGLLSDGPHEYAQLDAAAQRFARMLLFSVWPTYPFATYQEGLDELGSQAAARDEFSALVEWATAGATRIPRRLSGELGMGPLRSHARYTREELLAALDHASLDRLPGNFREGVLWARDLETDAFLITLNKDASVFSPTTMYRDYALSSTLFHWESQSQTRLASPTGQRYVNQRALGHHVLLFTRASGTWAFGKGAPYLLLGDADHVSHQGEQPIEIVWQLRRPMPESDFAAAGVELG